MNNLNGIENEIERLFELYKKTDPESETGKAIEKQLSFLIDIEVKGRELDEERRDRNLKYIFRGLEIGLPLAFAWVWMNKGLKFEEEGILKSTTFKTLWQKFYPKM